MPDQQSPPAADPRWRVPPTPSKLPGLINLPGFRHFTLRLPFHSPEEVRGWIERRTAGNIAIVACLAETVVGSADLRRFEGRRSHVGEVGLACMTTTAGAALVRLCWRR